MDGESLDNLPPELAELVRRYESKSDEQRIEDVRKFAEAVREYRKLIEQAETMRHYFFFQDLLLVLAKLYALGLEVEDLSDEDDSPDTSSSGYPLERLRVYLEGCDEYWFVFAPGEKEAPIT